MSHRIRQWKQTTVLFMLIAFLLGCKKQKTVEENPEVQPPSNFEALFSTHAVPNTGSAFVTDLKTKDGNTVGTVSVCNDDDYLYLSYRTQDQFYLTGVQTYAGKKTEIPVTASGNPNPHKFPGKLQINACDRMQTMTFKVPLSQLQSDENTLCATNTEFFIAMRATVRQIDGDCSIINDEDAWAAPVLINPGNADEWATAFYYCRQVYAPWCAFGQGYWFIKPNVEWCAPEVSFGNLHISKDDGRALWPAQANVLKRAFFQAAAIQLSMNCMNNSSPVPDAIAADYETLSAFLSDLTIDQISAGTMPAGADAEAIKTAANNIGTWICAHRCSVQDDPTICP
jgi:hypothetical protein